ncbi:unannotated protein [freshwater metagenome]|uniref:Unannotated protein n=2 Tax=freshwater metagenome TaxID=449393 RepID=A0A6J7IJ40_9ZZZZ
MPPGAPNGNSEDFPLSTHGADRYPRTMTTQENQPAGWYDDGTGQQRWWDGALWGDYAAPAFPPVPAGYQPKSRVAAGLLGILLGGFGAHNFYLGYTNKAILQLVLTIFTCGLASLWGLVEGILILTKNENFLTDAYGVPLVD